MKIALLGAGGFIGSRAVEIFHLTGRVEVRPVARRLASLARLSKFKLDARVADAFNRADLQEAFRDCDVVVHSIAGDRHTVLDTLAPAYQAAQEAGVSRLVYLSSASVHGQAPAPGSDESSPLSERQPIPYNNWKVRAEKQLRRLRQEGKIEVTVLRPGIVFGPRSRWIANFAEDLLAGRAYLIDRGQGICNSIYVDNLVQAIELAATVPGIDGEAFLIGDREQVRWADLYRPVAAALGVELDQVLEAEIPDFKTDWRDYVRRLHASKPVQAFLSLFPMKLRQAAFAAVVAWQSYPPASAWELPPPNAPLVSQEMALLYQCQYKFSGDKAAQRLGYEPSVSFAEGMRRTVGWLAFAGYPVIHQTLAEEPLSWEPRIA